MAPGTIVLLVEQFVDNVLSDDRFLDSDDTTRRGNVLRIDPVPVEARRSRQLMAIDGTEIVEGSGCDLQSGRFADRLSRRRVYHRADRALQSSQFQR